MDSNEVLKLIDAGFTADEIRAMKTPEPTEGTEPAEGNEPTEGTEGTEPSEPTKSPDLEALTASIKELQATVKSIQESNINNGKTYKPAVTDKIKDTIDSFIKEL